MSEKEIINVLSNLFFDEYEWYLRGYDAQTREDDKETIEKAIQGLLDLYNKEKEKNKKLERLNARYKADYISKEKITELAFYYNKNALDIEQNNMFRPATSKEQIEIDTNRAIARTLKKLLEERN